MQTVSLQTAQQKFPLIQIHPSPTRAEALVGIGDFDADARTFSLLSPSGVLSPSVLEAPQNSVVLGWGETGDDVLLLESQYKKGEPTRRTWRTWDRRTHAITELPERPKDRKFGDKNSKAYAGSGAPLRLVTEPGRIQTANKKSVSAKRATSCTVVEGTDDRERYVIAAPAERFEIVGKSDAPTLLFTQNNALFAVSTRSVTRDVYLGQVRQAVEKRVNKIGDALRMYSQDYDEKFPLQTGDALLAAAPYLGGGTGLPVAERYRIDPRTGEEAFTYTYNGVPDAKRNVALFTYKTTVGTYRVSANKQGAIVIDRDLPKP